MANSIITRFKNFVGLTQTNNPFEMGYTINDSQSIYKAVIPKFLYKPPFGYPRFVDIPELRRLAATPYVEMCISTIIDQAMANKWEIVPKDDENYNEEHINLVKDFFENPNIDKESFGAQLKKIIRDILTIDSGVWVKVFDQRMRLRELYVRDSGTFNLNPDIFGTYRGKAKYIEPDYRKQFMNPNFWTNQGNPRRENYDDLNTVARSAAYFQYGWITGARPMPFGTDEIIYIMRNPRADDIYGRSPVEILMDTIQMLIYGIDHNLDYYTDNNIPKGIVQLLNASDPDVNKFAEKWKEATRVKNEVGDYRKRWHHMPVINTDAKFERISFTNVELELIAQQEWFTKLVWACFGVTPSELGYTESSNRATEIVQSKVFRRKALRPLLKLIEYHINTEIMPHFKTGVTIHADTDEEKQISGIDDVKFEFDMYDVSEDLQKHELYELQLKNRIKTVNEIREELGLEAIEGGDELTQQMFQRNPFFDKQGQEPGEEKPDKMQEEKSVETKPFGEYADFDACVRANKDKSNPEAYCASVHKKVTGKWPSQKAFTMNNPLILEEFETLSDVKKVYDKELAHYKKIIDEKLGMNKGKNKIGEIKAVDNELIEEIKNALNMQLTGEALTKAIESAYLKSLEDVGIQLDRNLFPNTEALNFIKEFALDNVRDLTEEMKSKLRKELEMGLMAGESITKLKTRVKKVFETTKNRAEMIARTEINRAENAGLRNAYEQTGLKGEIEWVAHLDCRTSEICRHLDGKTVNMGEKFEYSGKNKWEGYAPPAHPNCRSRIVMIPK